MNGIVNRWRRGLGAVKIVGSLVFTFRWAKLGRLLGVNALFSEPRIVSNFSNMSALFASARRSAPFAADIYLSRRNHCAGQVATGAPANRDGGLEKRRDHL